MSSRDKKSKPADAPTGPKPTVFLRLPLGIHTWLVEEVSTGRYGNVQEKIVDVLRDAYETQVREKAAA